MSLESLKCHWTPSHVDSKDFICTLNPLGQLDVTNCWKKNRLMSLPLSCQIRLARTSGLSGSHTCHGKIRKHPNCMETWHSRPKQTKSACFLCDAIPSQACPKATKKGRISDTRLSAGLCYIVTSKTTHPWRIPGMLWSWNILDYLGEKHYCRDTHEARTTKQQLQGLRDKSQWDSLSLSDGEKKRWHYCQI